MYKLIQQLLFCLPAEASHNVAMSSMQWAHRLGLSSLLAPDLQGLARPRRVMGIEFPHAVGLAAGLDKNAEYVDALSALGFAFIEVGTLTPRPQPGNRKPRLFRLKEQQAIINRMGFNNRGIAYGLERLHRRRRSAIVGINIGKNFDTPVDRAAEDYLACLQACYQSADYVTVNISSPNTPGLRSLQYGDDLKRLLDTLKAEQDILTANYERYVPIAVKLAPDLEEGEVASCCGAIVEAGMDAIIATNTTLGRDGVAGSPLAKETGGLSGAPLTTLSTDVIRLIKSHVGDQVALIGVGGIMSGEDAMEKIWAGADLLQLYTGFIYHGPDLIRQILQAMADDSTDAVHH